MFRILAQDYEKNANSQRKHQELVFKMSLKDDNKVQSVYAPQTGPYFQLTVKVSTSLTAIFNYTLSSTALSAGNRRHKAYHDHSRAGTVPVL